METMEQMTSTLRALVGEAQALGLEISKRILLSPVHFNSND